MNAMFFESCIRHIGTTAALDSQISITQSETCHTTKISYRTGFECHRFKGPASNWNPTENTRKYQVTINNKVTSSNESPTVTNGTCSNDIPPQLTG